MRKYFESNWLGLFFLMTAMLSLMAFGCGGGGGGGGGGGIIIPIVSGTINGRVADSTGAPLAGVTVRAVDQNTIPVVGAADAAADVTTTTDGAGQYSLNMTQTDKALVTFTFNGFILTSRVVPVFAGETSTADAVMAPEGASASIDGAVGGTVTHNGGSATIKANSLVDQNGADYAGQVELAVTTFDPSVDRDFNAFPGEFQGKDQNGDTVPFESYGFMDVTPTDPAGNPLQLKTGQTADIVIPIPVMLRTMMVALPGTMPLWYYNPQSGVWNQEGTLTLNGAWDAYEGEIEHFSIWNADHPYARAFVKGRVVDSVGNPVTGAVVNIKGVAPRKGWAVYSPTGGGGIFPSGGSSWLPVEADSRFDIWVTKGGAKGAVTRRTSGPADSQQDLGDIVFQATPSGPYDETTLLAMVGFDFSEKMALEESDPLSDGFAATWDPSGRPGETGVWYVPNGFTTDVSLFKDMGTLPLTSILAAPDAWDDGNLMPALVAGRSYVAKCLDGYVKFHVLDVVNSGPHEYYVDIQYYWSATTTFAE
ncbi:MAG: carboxypeptidase-like regulatory domain-containing protein [Pseudomonadota bacterium]